MAINRASIAKELLPGLNAVFGMEYGEVNNELEPLFEIENSDRAFEEEVLFIRELSFTNHTNSSCRFYTRCTI